MGLILMSRGGEETLGFFPLSIRDYIVAVTCGKMEGKRGDPTGPDWTIQRRRKGNSIGCNFEILGDCENLEKILFV